MREELNQARRFITQIFHETIPVSRIQKTLSIIDVAISKIIDNDIENVFEKIHGLRAIIIFMIAFEKVVKDDVDKVLK